MTIPGITHPPTPARLAVGIVAGGRVGSALGVALERAGHVVWAASARTDATRSRLAERLPDTLILPPADVAARSELLVLAVPDAALPGVVAELAAHVRPGTIVVHVAGAHGLDVLAPVVVRGALPLALHPAMTFTGDAADIDRLAGAYHGVTAADGAGFAVAQMLIWELGGHPVPVADGARPLYHAALAHASNHLVTLVADAADMLGVALARPTVAPGANGDAPDAAAAARLHREHIRHLLTPLLQAALHTALDAGIDALTGPVRRGDAVTVARHLDVLGAVDAEVAASYRALATRTSRRLHARPPLGGCGPQESVLAALGVESDSPHPQEDR